MATPLPPPFETFPKIHPICSGNLPLGRMVILVVGLKWHCWIKSISEHIKSRLNGHKKITKSSWGGGVRKKPFFYDFPFFSLQNILQNQKKLWPSPPQTNNKPALTRPGWCQANNFQSCFNSRFMKLKTSLAISDSSGDQGKTFKIIITKIIHRKMRLS